MASFNPTQLPSERKHTVVISSRLKGGFFEEENLINKTIPIFEDKILAIGL